MRNVRFDNSGNVPVFRFINTDGIEDRIECPLSVDNLWDNLDPKSFSVELLINPFLNRARNVYNICKEGGNHKRVGMLFPVSALDSEGSFEQTGASNYAFIAFRVLLERLQEVKDSDGDFSDNFEENVCVCVFNLHTLKLDNPLHLCINSLRKYGYSFFEEYNTIQAVEGYKANLYVDDNVSNLVVRFEEPKLYTDPVIDMMLRALPHAHNVIHRFVLLYQIIETMMEAVTLKKIDNEIDKLQKNQIPHNDFLDALKQIGLEKERIKEIFDICQLSSDDFSCFKSPCKKLYQLTNYNPDKESDNSMFFYSFRNQMTHTFRNLHSYPDEVAETVQGFEKVIMTILERYV